VLLQAFGSCSPIAVGGGGKDEKKFRWTHEMPRLPSFKSWQQAAFHASVWLFLLKPPIVVEGGTMVPRASSSMIYIGSKDAQREGKLFFCFFLYTQFKFE
jgi:hypothetical protein